MDDQTPSEKTTLAKILAWNMSWEYVQLCKAIDRMNRIAAEARRRANAEGAESANKSCDSLDFARQTESHNGQCLQIVPNIKFCRLLC